MAVVLWAKRILWVVLIATMAGAAASYRYFITPPALRFVRGEATWIALSFLANAAIAAVLLLLLRSQRFEKDDE